MKIEVCKAMCNPLSGISRYNNNYYSLPITVNGCDILHEECDDDSNFIRTIGTLILGVYSAEFWLHTDERGESDCFIFDSELLQNQNQWT